MLIVQSIHNGFPRNPTDLYEQPAKWIAALDFLTPYANLEIEASRQEMMNQK